MFFLFAKVRGGRKKHGVDCVGRACRAGGKRNRFGQLFLLFKRWETFRQVPCVLREARYGFDEIRRAGGFSTIGKNDVPIARFPSTMAQEREYCCMCPEEVYLHGTMV